MVENIKKVEILRDCCFFLEGKAIRKNYRYKGGGSVEKSGKLRGGHLVFKWCFLNPISPPPPPFLIKMNGRLILGVKTCETHK